MSMRYRESIIVGCGCAGMNCALELKKRGRPYTVLCDYVGGRIFNDNDLHMNYGAVFFFGTYEHMLDPEKNIIQPTSDVLPRLRDGFCHPDNKDHSKQYAALSARTVADFPSLMRYMRFMRNEFLPRYGAFKKNCETMEVRAALEVDPFIEQLYHETAEDFIDRQNFGPICGDLINMFAHACTGSRVDALSALDYLNCVQPLTLEIPSLKRRIPLTRFDFDKTGMARRLAADGGGLATGDAGTVVSVVRNTAETRGRWCVACKNGDRYTCDNLVMATPVDVTARLLDGLKGIPRIKVRNASVLYGYILEGVPKSAFAQGVVHIFSDDTPIIFIAKREEAEGRYEIFTEVEFEDSNLLTDYFEPGWKVLGSKYWPQALFTNPNWVNPNDLDEGLILAGDCNGLGMEPAAISGVYAANKILGRAVN